MYKLIPYRENFFFLQYAGDSWPTSSNICVIPDSDGLNLIDAGLNKQDSFRGLKTCIEKFGFAASDIHTILLTHGHTDHIAGVNIINQYANPRIILSDKSIPEAVDPAMQEHYCLPSSVRKISSRLKNYDILANFETTCGPWRLNGERILPVEDGDEIKIGDYTFQAIHCPGHDIGLMVFYEPEIKLLLTTDLLKASRPGNALPWYSSSAGSPGEYLRSLDKVAKLDVKMAFPSHGALSGAFTETVARTKRVIMKRQTEIVASLKKGAKTCDQLDSILFKPIVMELCPWFSCVTESHLVELEMEGIVTRNGLEFVFLS